MEPSSVHHRTLSARGRRDFFQYSLLILPALLIYVAFQFVPVIADIGISLTNALAGGINSSFIGLGNFHTLLFTDSPQHQIFVRAAGWTALYWLGNWVLNIVWGLGLALILYEGIRLKQLFTIVIFAPYVVSNLALGYIMALILDPNSGAINWIWTNIGAKSPIMFLREGWPANLTLIVVTGWKFAGFNMALFLAGIVMIPVDTIEAAVIAGCSYSQRLRYVILPQLWPTMVSVSVLCFTGTWQLFALPVALAGTAQGGVQSLNTIAVIFYRWAFGREGFGLASAMMVLVGIVLFAGAVLSQFIVKKKTIEY